MAGLLYRVSIQSKRYEDAYGDIPEQAESLNWLISQLPLRSKILDIGSGTGKPTADALASAGYAVHGIDILEGMICWQP
jgi:2-polyprenyl-3-methyl-5-hydroxy-6-metoxy-1,4-benzoquinol methylase